MALFAISDLHLDLTGEKPMDIFGNKWFKHDEKIKNNWIKKITDEDTVLIAGDISWSMKIEDGMNDLKWIHELPGKKIIVKGNHDYWWSSITKLNNLYEDMKFIQNNFFTYEDYGICGTRGWTCPGGENFSEHDNKIYIRELMRLKLSLDSAKKNGYDKLIVMIHYPPMNEKLMDSGFVQIFSEYNVEKVIYGHLHGPSLAKAFTGEKDGIDYILTSGDFISFDPVKIL
ncbi:metallophosphoesterase [Clostridium sp. DJ247]|uniref:metallophosphoesterase n=1 Tax=Clostridium sp. DJ247 TaxID=2726188 RepID=UPI00162324A7|nr:metallophosphoesterase [Clostridium sp. DJ247]MBC2582232.1 serine/threonine protein phosphatase [Clostridium sp. DJ247]